MSLVEKYKPNSLSTVIGQDLIVSSLRKLLEDHTKYPRAYMLYGEYGIGKTSIVDAFYSDMEVVYNCEYFSYDISIMGKKENIEGVKDKIENVFSFSDKLRIIHFEEIQEASKAAQSLLLTMLEKYTKNIIYFFTTTDMKKLLPALVSRCLPFYIKNISDDDMFSYLTDISGKEKINVVKEDMGVLVKFSHGHMRNALHFLDMYVMGKEVFYSSTKEIYNDISGYLCGDIGEKIISRYNVSSINNIIDIVIYDMMKKGMELDGINAMALFDRYSKFKDRIMTFHDMMSFLLILKKLIVSYLQRKDISDNKKEWARVVI
jgi:DNA polymerase III gamma/tau subunit